MMVVVDGLEFDDAEGRLGFLILRGAMIDADGCRLLVLESELVNLVSR